MTGHYENRHDDDMCFQTVHLLFYHTPYNKVLHSLHKKTGGGLDTINIQLSTCTLTVRLPYPLLKIVYSKLQHFLIIIEVALFVASTLYFISCFRPQKGGAAPPPKKNIAASLLLSIPCNSLFMYLFVYKCLPRQD
jgi:hypothetical protein